MLLGQVRQPLLRRLPSSRLDGTHRRPFVRNRLRPASRRTGVSISSSLPTFGFQGSLWVGWGIGVDIHSTQHLAQTELRGRPKSAACVPLFGVAKRTE